MMPAPVALAPLLRPDPDPARDWVREELAKREYQPTLMERMLRWLNDLIDKLVHGIGGVSRLDPLLALPLLVVLLGLVLLVLSRLRRDPSRPPRTAAVLGEERISAAEHPPRSRPGRWPRSAGTTWWSRRCARSRSGWSSAT